MDNLENILNITNYREHPTRPGYTVFHFFDDKQANDFKKLLEEAGCYETNVVPTLESAGWHLMGTAKMGNDPKTSVVDSNCKTHDVDNLYIIDGSVFTTSAAVNPTPTIQAVALRAADKILQG